MPAYNSENGSSDGFGKERQGDAAQVQEEAAGRRSTFWSSLATRGRVTLNTSKKSGKKRVGDAQEFGDVWEVEAG